MAHLINRLQFEINCPDEEQAFNFRHNFAVTFQEQIVQVVDKVCSKYISEEQWIRIDKLEIDLARFSPHSFDINFTEVFRNKFEKELTQKLSEISSSQKKASRQLSRAELFQYFLQNGILPWWADEAQIDLDEISLDLLLNQPEMVKHFFYKHRFEANVWQRAALQLNSEAKTLIVSLIEELKNTQELFVAWLQQLNLIMNNTTNFELKVSDESIDHILLKNAPKIFQNEKNNTILLQILEDSIAVISLENKALIERIIHENKAVFLQISKEEFSHINEADSGLSNMSIYREFQEEEFSGKYLVKHAGVILLAPFLKPFFTTLDLLHGIEWKNKDAQYKAVHLLKFLSTGWQKTPEYNLTLEKIICGIAIEEPISVEVLLHEKETNEAEMLLESVLEHWKSLKNTSVNGLRETFLKRDGLIKKQENDWLLQVERKTLDMLIDSIPWGYTAITLPWNSYLIFVEW